jgi:hypothetical protein
MMVEYLSTFQVEHLLTALLGMEEVHKIYLKNPYNITNLASGNYNVTVTDAKGCSTTCQSIINNIDCKLDASITSENVKCFGVSDGKITLVLSNAVGNPIIVWSNPVWNGQTTITNAPANFLCSYDH